MKLSRTAHRRAYSAVADAVPRPAATATPSRSVGRLPGVDGLRAAAALWVLLFHMHAFSTVRLWPGLDQLAAAGSAGVSLFLLLSGFCLYAPFAGARLSRFKVMPFLRRRCRRLLPAYYASLVVVLVVHWLADGRYGFPQLTTREYAEQTATHALLAHQFFPSTFYGLNGAYWSLGLEWELYLALPLVIACVLRWGLRTALLLVTSTSVGYSLLLQAAVAGGMVAEGSPLATVVLPNVFLGRWFEFALGILAAELYLSGRLVDRMRLVWFLAVPAALGSVVARDNPLEHVFHGLVFFALLCTVLVGDNLVAKAFAWRPLAAVGVMSYSLYLVHQPVVESAAAMMRESGMSSAAIFLGLAVLVPVIFGAAGVLFFAVEKPSMKAPSESSLARHAVRLPSMRERPDEERTVQQANPGRP
jgi:peptidoglycan/LPS O-acetylase OafA/YrhL